MKNTFRSLTLLLALTGNFALFTLAQADDLPDLGDASATSMSSLDELKIGHDAYQAMLDANEIIDDTEVNTYINKIGQSIASGVENQQKFTYFVVDDGSINAFAMPGGYIGVNRGLLLTTQSEGELASVLAHETAHVAQHHMARMKASNTQNQLWLLAALVAGAVAASQGRGDLAGGALQAGVGLSISNQLSYSRDFEREADRIGMQYLVKAGFDARSMPEFFSRMQQVTRFNDNNAYAFLRTHPVTNERISEGEDRAAHYPIRMKNNSVDYLMVREKLRVANMLARDAIQYYEKTLAEHRYISEGAQYYGLARAQMLMRNWSAANTALNQAKKHLPPNAMLLSSAAEIAHQSGQLTLAHQLYKSALKSYPDNQTLMYGDLDVLIEKGERKLGLEEVKKYLLIYSENSDLYQRQARLFGQKDALHYHAALGNAFYFAKRLRTALEQYQLALLATGDDFYLRSSIDARIKDLKQIIQYNASHTKDN